MNSLISVQKDHLNSQVAIPVQINFKLTNSNLAKINEQRIKNQKIKISSELLADLRYYVLIQNYNYLGSELTFVSYYTQQNQKTAIIKSIISLQGKISQQISRTLLTNPLLLNDLISNHYWLINQLCDRLPLNYQNYYFRLNIILSSVIILLVAPILFYFLEFNWLLKLIVLSGLFGLLYLLISIVTKKYLSSIILQQLIFGFFSKNTARRHLAFILLRYFNQ